MANDGEKACPYCNGNLIAVVTVDYIHRVNRKTGRVAKRGERAAQQLHIQCGDCGAYQTTQDGKFIQTRR